LIRERGILKIYGAGIASSYGESKYALYDARPNRITFDLERVMRTEYRIDRYQQTYFVIDSFENLRHQTADADFGPLYHRLEGLVDVAPDTVLRSDRLIALPPNT
jgi:phenylalanine-4-hydroxylase